MPESFGINILDSVSPPPAEGAVVLLEGDNTTSSERLVFKLLQNKPAIVIDPYGVEDALPHHFGYAPSPLPTDRIWRYTDLSQLEDTPLSKDIVAAVEAVVIDGVQRLDHSARDIINNCRTLMNTINAHSECYLLIHLDTSTVDRPYFVSDLRRQADLIAELTPKKQPDKYSQEFLITKNRLGQPMESPRPLVFEDDNIKPDPSRDIG